MAKSKTFILMTILVLIFMFFGNLIAGAQGMKMAFVAALGLNFFSYFFSDSLVLKHYRAIEVNNSQSPELYEIVADLAREAQLPMPKVYIIPDDVPNAFATGRSPKHAAVAATQGLLKILSKDEVKGVLAHEMSHVRNYDILTGTIAATFAGAIAYLANFARARTANQQRGNGAIAAIMMPIAASIIQMSISREREYKADEGSANLTGHPMWLASALQKLEDAAKGKVLTGATAQNSHMFIVNPLGLSQLFSTHPSTQDRVKRLQEIALGMRAE
ncbi:MAG: zinc metalloprotease HtpX [Alphaproteobacteria bacterium]|nr:zinc metalloprotease HtpX [Alphaproteobacteria bacterium]